MHKKILVLLLSVALLLTALSSCTLATQPSPDESSVDPSDTTEDISSDDITTEEADVTTEKYYYTRPGEMNPYVLENFDLTLSHKPTVNDLLSLLANMDLKKGFWFEEEVPISEIITRFGKPHDFGVTNMLPSFVWYTEEGMYLCVTFYPPGEKCPTDIDPVQWYLEGGMAFKIFMYYNQEDSPQPIPSYVFEK